MTDSSDEKKSKETPPINWKSVILYGGMFMASFVILLSACFFYYMHVQKQMQSEQSTSPETVVADSLKIDSVMVAQQQPDGTGTVALGDSILQEDVTAELNEAQTKVPTFAEAAGVAPPLSEDVVNIIEGYEARIAELQKTNYYLEYDLDQMKVDRRQQKEEIETAVQKILNEHFVGLTQKLSDLQGSIASKDAENAQSTTVAAKVGPKELAKIYDTMRPEHAAAVLSQLDVNIVVQIISNLKQRQAGKILGAMPTERAAQISRLMSQRKTG